MQQHQRRARFLVLALTVARQIENRPQLCLESMFSILFCVVGRNNFSPNQPKFFFFFSPLFLSQKIMLGQFAQRGS